MNLVWLIIIVDGLSVFAELLISGRYIYNFLSKFQWIGN